MANLATKSSVTDGPLLRINTPLIDMTKAQIISKGTQLGVDYSLTTSCYDPSNDGHPCEHCDSCLLRAKGFAEAGLPGSRAPLMQSNTETKLPRRRIFESQSRK